MGNGSRVTIDPKVASIPVYLGEDWAQPVGRAIVDTDGDIWIIANGDIMIRDLPRLAELGQIIGLGLHVMYKPAVPKES